jgi:hypothetical protein
MFTGWEPIFEFEGETLAEMDVGKKVCFLVFCGTWAFPVGLGTNLGRMDFLIGIKRW